ncbi:hypothetical protein F4861DRAFT_461963 [Xylaria intraflava]|nr:hypothetical protein F4861DRAFT_461963 [Xylaria intraflava]
MLARRWRCKVQGKKRKKETKKETKWNGGLACCLYCLFQLPTRRFPPRLLLWTESFRCDACWALVVHQYFPTPRTELVTTSRTRIDLDCCSATCTEAEASRAFSQNKSVEPAFLGKSESRDEHQTPEGRGKNLPSQYTDSTGLGGAGLRRQPATGPLG